MSDPSTPQRTAAAELLLVSPMALSGLALSSSRKRRITPTAEASSPKRIAVITSPGAVSPLLNRIRRSSLPNPIGWHRLVELAHIDQRLPLYERTYPLFQDTTIQGPQMPPPSRHIILPFDLRDQPGEVLLPEKQAMVKAIFPGMTGIAWDGFFVVLQLRTLPPKPWPLTIGGVPLYLTLNLRLDHPISQPKLVGWRNGSIADDQNGLQMGNWEPLFHVIKDHLYGLGVSITEVMYWGSFFIVVLKHRDADIGKLPFRVAKIACLYLFEDQMGRPLAPQARRFTDPTPGNPDHSQYANLQPGLRLTSSYIPSDPDKFFSSTSGVLLQDQVGNEYMTAAAHGFPAECGTHVFHALPENGRRVGEIIMEISHTDVALVKLQDTERFYNLVFQSDHSTIPQQIQLRRLVPLIGRPLYELVYLDSPDTGFINGITSGVTSFQAIPSDDNSPRQQWIFTTWTYMGQDSGLNLPAGMCGSAIWNEDGDVLGLFRFAPKDGVMRNWCCGLAADELINRGFTLVDTSIDDEDASAH